MKNKLVLRLFVIVVVSMFVFSLLPEWVDAGDCPSSCYWNSGFNRCTGPWGCVEGTKENCDSKHPAYWGQGYCCDPCSSAPSCSDDCTPSGSYGCKDDERRVCGNFDSDSCLEWGSASCTGPYLADPSCDGGKCVYKPAELSVNILEPCLDNVHNDKIFTIQGKSTNCGDITITTAWETYTIEDVDEEFFFSQEITIPESNTDDPVEISISGNREDIKNSEDKGEYALVCNLDAEVDIRYHNFFYCPHKDETLDDNIFDIYDITQGDFSFFGNDYDWEECVSDQTITDCSPDPTDCIPSEEGYGPNLLENGGFDTTVSRDLETTYALGWIRGTQSNNWVDQYAFVDESNFLNIFSYANSEIGEVSYDYKLQDLNPGTYNLEVKARILMDNGDGVRLQLLCAESSCGNLGFGDLVQGSLITIENTEWQTLQTSFTVPAQTDYFVIIRAADGSQALIDDIRLVGGQ